jgi:hypothetical protein
MYKETAFALTIMVRVPQVGKLSSRCTLNF